MGGLVDSFGLRRPLERSGHSSILPPPIPYGPVGRWR
jgi:hypothetical protein